MVCNLSGALVGVVNFGAGNLGNVRRALARLDTRHEQLDSPDDMAALGPSILLLPGVGAFRPAIARLISTGWRDALIEWTSGGRPLLGICLGMQLFCSRSGEGGEENGLGLIEGTVERLSGVKKIPHMGWNTIIPDTRSEFPVCCLVKPGQNFYFVHSYAVADSPDGAADTEVDGVTFHSVLRRENVAGFQFHPERSGPDGVDFLGRAIAYFIERYS
ncbi:MAG: imidazole glycerol phosphate synthase subunit HisH [Synergistaceae bacterium]|nr:imidazole glycerol phosphate synthase subunit HisH [Synergistaceae bacterium]